MLGVTRQSSEPQMPITAADIAQPWNEINIYERAGPGHAHFHQRDQALTTGNQARLLTQLLEKLGGLHKCPPGHDRRKDAIVSACLVGWRVRSWTAAKNNCCISRVFALWNERAAKAKWIFRLRRRQEKTRLLI